MSYQERKYNQNGNFNRNFAGSVPTTSSDICVFNRPSFIMSGATKIDCPEVICNINNIPYNDLFTGTTNCFIQSALSGSCFNGINWITNIYEDNNLSYSNTFYTSTSLSGTVIDVSIFSGSVLTAFDTLDYDYSFDGTGFTITKPLPIENIRLELTTELEFNDICLFTGNCSTNEVICDLTFSGLTLNDTNVHLLTGQTEINLTFNFTGNTSSFIDDNAKFKYEIYKYIPELGLFNKPSIYSSEYLEWSEFSGTSAFTDSVLVNSLNPDGEYLVKGHFIHNVCTEFATLLGYTYSTTSNISGESYGIYESSRDNYFIMFNNADEPILQNGTDDNVIGSLTVASLIIEDNTTEFLLPYTTSNFIISLNGLVLANELDYSLSSLELESGIVNRLNLSGVTVSGDILTYVYTNSETFNNIKAENFDILTPITSGTTNNEGSNTVYYNTDTNKYELFLSMVPVNGNDIVLTLNGIMLANNIDYYQSISNPKRIIINGNIIIGDILTVYYNTNTNIQDEQFGTSILVNWLIQNAPQNNNGHFTVEIASDINFNNIILSGTINYEAGSTGYGLSVNLIGGLGDKQYYRVKNTKKFTTLCGETLISEKYSEIVPITIQTNLNNSY